MQALILVLFSSAFLLDWMHRYGMLPRAGTWTIELIGIIALVVVVFRAARQGGVDLGIGYGVLFILFITHVTVGILLNTVPEGALFTGVRVYFKFLPFFLIPAVYVFTDKDIAQQMKVLLGLVVFQFPVASYQLFVEAAGPVGVDVVGGTVGTSGHLSVVLMCAAAMWMAHYYRMGTLTTTKMLVGLAIIVAPTFMNLSKGTLLLAPLALFGPALLDNSMRGGTRRIATTVVVFVAFSIVFVNTYNAVKDAHSRSEGEYDVVEFFLSEDKLKRYLIRSESTDAEKAGRIGGMLIALRELSVDPSRIFFGLGIGNVSKSFFGARYAGEYYHQYGELGGATIGRLLWEIGLFGVVLIYSLCFLVLRDAMALRQTKGLTGMIGIGWGAVILVIMLSMFYKNIINNNVIGVVFWFYSGYVAATACRLRTRRIEAGP